MNTTDITITAPATCDCGNAATETLTNGAHACEWCATHEGCSAPDTITFHAAWLTGAPLATCDACGHEWGYWDCGCDLVHACVIELTATVTVADAFGATVTVPVTFTGRDARGDCAGDIDDINRENADRLFSLVARALSDADTWTVGDITASWEGLDAWTAFVVAGDAFDAPDLDAVARAVADAA